MYQKQWMVQGENVQTLTSLLAQALTNSRVMSRGTVDVLFVEQFYLRIDSTLMSVVLLAYTSPTQCQVDILSGGGTRGFFDVSWGAEETDVERIFGLLTNVTQQQAWQVQEVPLSP